MTQPPSTELGEIGDAGWLQTVQARIAATQYRFQERPEGLVASNPALSLHAVVGTDGRLELRGEAGAGRRIGAHPASWIATLETRGFGRAGEARGLASGELGLGRCLEPSRKDAMGDCLPRAELHRGGLREWFDNRPEGIEHGWTLTEPPAGSGPVELQVAVPGSMALLVDDGARWTPEVGPSLSYSALRAWDADGEALRARFVSAGGDAVTLQVDDRGARYPVTIDPLVTVEPWVEETPPPGDDYPSAFGEVLSGAGDVNGDGYADVLIGAPEFFGGNWDEGAAFLFLGGPAGLSNHASWSVEGGFENARLGYSVAGGGDVDGDGFDDLVVTRAPLGGQADALYIYRGAATGPSAAADWTLSGIGQAPVIVVEGADGDGYADIATVTDWDSSCGATPTGACVKLFAGSPTGPTSSPAWAYGLGASALSASGDVNGDGVTDLLVAQPGYENGQQSEGRALLFLGTGDASAFAATPAWTFETNQANAGMSSVAILGDINGDSRDEVLVGAQYYTDVGYREGRVWLFWGQSGGLSSSPGQAISGSASNQWFGDELAAAGDVDGDGRSDAVIGARGNDGAAYVYLGTQSGLAGSAAWERAGTDGYGSFGAAVAGAGDVNADGYDDVLIGQSSQLAASAAHLLYGGPNGIQETSAWRAEGNQDNAELGVSLSWAGDVNGDTYGDVVIGSSLFDGSLADEGAAFVYLGGPTGLPDVASWSQQGGQASAAYGAAVGSAGDVNGDGFSDLIVGAFLHDAPEDAEGRAYVYLGSPSGLSASADWTAESDQAAAHFGRDVASAGDVDGDGFGDVIVAALYYDNGNTDEGAAFVYRGSASGLKATPSWTAEGDQDSALFGHSVAAAGDVNGDGFADVIVGAPQFDDTLNDEGSASVFLGSPAGLEATAAWSTYGGQADALFGWDVASAGDVDADGYADIIVGARDYTGTHSAEGGAFLFPGSASGPAASPSWTQTGGDPGAAYGYAVSSAGDINSDGYADVAVGARLYSNGAVDEGKAWLYLGTASGLATASSWSEEGDQADALFGQTVAAAGDVDGDGHGDLLVGALRFDNGQSDEGAVSLFHGGRDLP